MYVCLCHAVTEEEIRAQVTAGAMMQDLQEKLRVGTCCGCCVDDIVAFLPGRAESHTVIRTRDKVA